MDTFQDLLQRTWGHFHDCLLTHPKNVAKDSIPILYFGDREQYQKSKLKVITVALNPSTKEFPASNGRFGPAPSLLYKRWQNGEDIASDYFGRLNKYFTFNPYTTWFNESFEWMLRGMGVSYYDEFSYMGTALHTDLCTPIATDPTWGSLKEKQSGFMKDGFNIWTDLVRALSPDVMLISVREEYKERWVAAFPPEGESTTIFRLWTKPSYVVTGSMSSISDNKQALVVFGYATQKPFGAFDTDRKYEIGQRIHQLLKFGRSEEVGIERANT